MYTLKQLQSGQRNFQTSFIATHPAAVRPAIANNPFATKQQALSNQTLQRLKPLCPQRLPGPSLCPFGGVCHTCPARVQAKLTINEPGDQYEQDADRVADQVMRMPEPGVQQVCPSCDQEETNQTKHLAGQITPLVQRQDAGQEEEAEEPIQAKLLDEGQRQEEETEEEEEEELFQTKAAPGRTPMVIPKIQAQIITLRGEGRPLSRSTRAFFEPRFGLNFSQVRIHDDAQAVTMTRGLNARAFTTGNNIAFGASQYAPESTTGRRLIAHELTHTIQQSSHQASIQRQASAQAVRKDLVLLLSPGLRAEAAVLAPNAKVLPVNSAAVMAKKLRRQKFPIRRLIIISHSLSTGDLGFEKGNTTTFVRPPVLAKKLTGTVSAANAPESIDFRGCSLGSSPAGMEKIRAALGAGSAIAGNCFIITHIQGPISISSRKITRASQVTKARRPAFERGMNTLRKTFGKAKDCILDESEQAYFRARGKLVAQWASPHIGTSWDDRKSKCYKNLVTETVDPARAGDTSPGLIGHCKLIKIEKTP